MKKLIALMLVFASVLGALGTTAFAGKQCTCKPCKCNPCECTKK